LKVKDSSAEICWRFRAYGKWSITDM